MQPVASHGAALLVPQRQRRQFAALDAPLDASQLSLADAGRLWHSQGLPVRERVRLVRAWCVRSHRYVVVGQCVVWEVR